MPDARVCPPATMKAPWNALRYTCKRHITVPYSPTIPFHIAYCMCPHKLSALCNKYASHRWRLKQVEVTERTSRLASRRSKLNSALGEATPLLWLARGSMQCT